MPTVFANSRSIVHKGDGQVNTAAPPDVCKTPSPGGPVPIPYVNVAKTSDLAKGTKKVKIEGNAAGNAGSNLSISTGDEAGTAGGGIISSKTKGKMTWATKSATVLLEGKGAVRFMDVDQHNGNSFNTVFTQMGGTGMAYADDFQGQCEICRNGPADHRAIETASSAQLCRDIIQALTDAYNNAASNNQRKKIGNNGGGYMVGVMSCKHDPSLTFAARSGRSNQQFESIAGPFVTKVIGGGTVEPDEFIRANTSGVARSRVSQKMLAACQTVEREANNRTPGFNPLGSCAGSKLLARSGHAPVEMTEMFFKPPGTGTWDATYSVITNRNDQVAPAWLRSVLDNAMSRREDVPYSTGMPVASCRSCQTTLYLTMCPERVCT